MNTLVIDRYIGNGNWAASLLHRPGVRYTIAAPAGALKVGDELELRGNQATPKSGLCTSYIATKN